MQHWTPAPPQCMRHRTLAYNKAHMHARARTRSNPPANSATSTTSCTMRDTPYTASPAYVVASVVAGRAPRQRYSSARYSSTWYVANRSIVRTWVCACARVYERLSLSV